MKLLLLILSIFSAQYLLATESLNKEKVLKNHQLINLLMGEEVFIEKTISANRSARVIRESRPTREARLTRETRPSRTTRLARDSRVSRTIHLVRESRPSRVIQITHNTQPKKKSSLKACTKTKSTSMQLAKKK